MNTENVFVNSDEQREIIPYVVARKIWIKFEFYYKFFGSLLLIIFISSMTSCVQGDSYDLYDEDELFLETHTKKTKVWSDPMLSVQGTHNGKAIFYNTECAAFALSYYLSGGELEGEINNSVKLQAIKALMNWNYSDDSFAYNEDLNNLYKTEIMDKGGGASTQDKMIPAIRRLFNQTYVAATDRTGFLNKMQNDIDEEGNVSGMYFIITKKHISVPYHLDRNTSTFTCHDCDGSYFTAEVYSDIISILLKDPDSNN